MVDKLSIQQDLQSSVSAEAFSFWYGKNQALCDVSISIPSYRITSLIGPSGCGKTTFLRSINRMNDRIPGCRVRGKMFVDDLDVYGKKVDLMSLRRKVGMVFQKPNPFPSSIYENVAMAPRIHYGLSKSELNDLVEESLTKAALWDEVKDSLRKNALELSGGQQQRLCIARTLAVMPQIILMDEPTSALDPISSYRVEELIMSLSKEFTLIVVTHNMHQAARISDFTAFFMLGNLVEFGSTEQVFQRPSEKSTEDYVSGRFG